MSRKLSTLVALSFLASGWLFLGRLKPAGLFYWDQAYYSVEAQTAWTIISKVPDAIKGRPIQEIKNEIHEKCGGIFPGGAAKPSFIALLTLFSKLKNFEDISASLLSGFWGWMSLILVFLIGKKLWDVEYGLWSAGILALSTVQLFCARNGTPTITAIFFFLAGFLLLLHNRIFFSGLIFGLAYTCHYGLLPNFMILIASLMVLAFYQRDANRALLAKTCFRWLGGLLTIPVLWEIVYQSIYFGLGPSRFKDFEFHTYFYFIWRQFILGGLILGGSDMHWKLGFFPKLLIQTQGWPYFLLFLIGLAWLMIHLYRNRSFGPLWMVATQAGLVFLMWIFKTGYVGTRVIAFVVPFQCLVIGFLIRDTKPKTLKGLLYLAAVLPALIPIHKLLNLKSGYADAASFLQAGPERMVAFENGPLWHFYLGQKKIYRIPQPFSEAQVTTDIADGKIRFLAVDFADTLSKETHKIEKQWVKKIQMQLQPAKIIPNPSTCDPIFQYERDELEDFRKNPEACSILLYDLSMLPLKST